MVEVDLTQDADELEELTPKKHGKGKAARKIVIHPASTPPQSSKAKPPNQKKKNNLFASESEDEEDGSPIPASQIKKYGVSTTSTTRPPLADVSCSRSTKSHLSQRRPAPTPIHITESHARSIENYTQSLLLERQQQPRRDQVHTAMRDPRDPLTERSIFEPLAASTQADMTVPIYDLNSSERYVGAMIALVRLVRAIDSKVDSCLAEIRQAGAGSEDDPESPEPSPTSRLPVNASFKSLIPVNSYCKLEELGMALHSSPQLRHQLRERVGALPRGPTGRAVEILLPEIIGNGLALQMTIMGRTKYGLFTSHIGPLLHQELGLCFHDLSVPYHQDIKATGLAYHLMDQWLRQTPVRLRRT